MGNGSSSTSSSNTSEDYTALDDIEKALIDAKRRNFKKKESRQRFINEREPQYRIGAKTQMNTERNAQPPNDRTFNGFLEKEKLNKLFMGGRRTRTKHSAKHHKRSKNRTRRH
jgi:hypothetical protein